MNAITLTNSASSSKVSPYFFNYSVFEYSLSVIDRSGDIQHLTAAFVSVPSALDWANWLDGWSSCGYSVFAQPVLIRTI